jgi:drug/metabolite transporter (DMT)-like permease
MTTKGQATVQAVAQMGVPAGRPVELRQGHDQWGGHGHTRSQQQRQRHVQGWGIAAGLAAGALWGLVFVAPRMAPGFSPVDVATGRFVAFGAAALTFLLWRWWRGAARPTRSQWLAASGMSVLGFSGYYTSLAVAIAWAGTAVPALIVGTIPIVVMLLGKPAGMLWRHLALGLLATACGIALMGWQTLSHVTELQAGVFARQFWQGSAMAVLSMVSWTVFALWNASWLKRNPQVSSFDWTSWIGIPTALGALLLWALMGTPFGDLMAAPKVAWSLAICAFTGVGSAWVAGWLWNVASKRLSASLCGQLIVSETLFALVFGFVWDGGWPNVFEWLAAVLFVTGIVASIRAHR